MHVSRLFSSSLLTLRSPFPLPLPLSPLPLSPLPLPRLNSANSERLPL